MTGNLHPTPFQKFSIRMDYKNEIPNYLRSSKEKKNKSERNFFGLKPNFPIKSTQIISDIKFILANLCSQEGIGAIPLL